jgi:hypothetical protein
MLGFLYHQFIPEEIGSPFYIIAEQIFGHALTLERYNSLTNEQHVIVSISLINPLR